MPQLDKLTFYSIAYGVTVVYILQYLLISTSYLFHLVSSMKTTSTRKTYALRVAKITRQRIVVLLNNPNVATPKISL